MITFSTTGSWYDKSHRRTRNWLTPLAAGTRDISDICFLMHSHSWLGGELLNMYIWMHVIPATSNDHQDSLIHPLLDSLFSCLHRLTPWPTKIPKLRITGALWRESIGDLWRHYVVRGGDITHNCKNISNMCPHTLACNLNAFIDKNKMREKFGNDTCIGYRIILLTCRQYSSRPSHTSLSDSNRVPLPVESCAKNFVTIFRRPRG